LALILAPLASAACAGAVDTGSENAIVPPTGECTLGDSHSCKQEVDPDHQGRQTCEEVQGKLVWSACEVDLKHGKDSCAANETWNGYCCENVYSCCAGDLCNTPLVLSFGEQAVEYSASQGATFDLSGMGLSQAFDWPTAATPWLALDRDGSGAIEAGHELFGSAVRLANDTFANNGFQALAEFDGDKDGRIDASDAVFAKLLVWRDRDGDRVSQPSELTTLSANGVTSIELRYTVSPECDARGNCAIERAGFSYTDGLVAKVGRVIDVHLRVR
jgi:hypothetical protein